MESFFTKYIKTKELFERTEPFEISSNLDSI